MTETKLPAYVAGDRVRVTTGHPGTKQHGVPEGATGTVQRVDTLFGHYTVEFDAGTSLAETYYNSSVEGGVAQIMLEGNLAPEFAVGDAVRVKAGTDGTDRGGQVGTVTRVSGVGWSIGVTFPDDVLEEAYDRDELERRPFKVGDRVMVLAGRGTLGTVTMDDGEDVLPFWVKCDDPDRPDADPFDADELEALPAEDDVQDAEAMAGEFLGLLDEAALEFGVGDRVRITKRPPYLDDAWIGREGTVTDVSTDDPDGWTYAVDPGDGDVCWTLPDGVEAAPVPPPFAVGDEVEVIVPDDTPSEARAYLADFEPYGVGVVDNVQEGMPYRYQVEWSAGASGVFRAAELVHAPQVPADPATLASLQERAGTIAADKGWHSIGSTLGDRLALIHSEVSEALEAYRHDGSTTNTWAGYDGKPEGVPSELADVVIRVLDLCYVEGIDLEAAVKAKLAYNAGRPHLHGGKHL